MGVQIKKIEYYLPEKIISNFYLEKEFKEWNAEKMESKTGIRERHIVKEDETALDLAYQASHKVLQNYEKERIDFLILCTQSPEYYLPTGACILQDKLKLKTEIGAFDYNLGCSGYIYGLALAKSLIECHLANSILLIMSETYSKHIHPQDRANRTIFGDGAAASIIERSDKNKIFAFCLGTDGRGYQHLIVPNGGIRNRYNPEEKEEKDASGNVRTKNHLYMNGPEIFNFTIESVPLLVENTLKKNQLSLEKIDYVIFHQANKYMLEYLRKKTKIPEEKFYLNLLKTGNTVSATIPIAIKDCLERGKIKEGDRVLLIGFGVGYSWGGVVVEI